MRRKVPFMGEEHLIRAEDEESQAKKARGQLIDDVISTQKQPSTWDDHVAPDYFDPFGAPPKVLRPHAHMPMPMTAPTPAPAPTRPKRVPVTPGAVPKKAVIESSSNSSISNSVNSSNSYTSAKMATIDWKPINSGHALRINIFGNLDQNLHSEWRRLIAETEANGIGQFEFNLTDAPSLTLTGLGMLLLFKEQKGSERGDIKLCHCNKDVWQMLQWTGMDKYFTIQAIPGT
jgi:anti-anti-sigma factor